MAYGDIEDLARRIAAGIQYYKTAFNIAKTPKYDGCAMDLEICSVLLIFVANMQALFL